MFNKLWQHYSNFLVNWFEYLEHVQAYCESMIYESTCRFSVSRGLPDYIFMWLSAVFNLVIAFVALLFTIVLCAPVYISDLFEGKKEE